MKIFDTIIIGGGPGGYTAAIYATRGGMQTLLIKSAFKQSQITITDDVENYPGFDLIGGFELMSKFSEQAAKFGLETVDGDVESLKRDGDHWAVSVGDDVYRATTIIIATGAAPNKLGAQGEAELAGRGVSYCATCDGPFYRNREVVVVGGGDTAVQEACFLTKFASKVTIVHRRDRLRATGVLSDRAHNNDRIDFAWNSTVEKIYGEGGVEGVTVKDVKSGETRDIAAEGAFIFVGYTPETGIFKDLIDLDESGYIVTDEHMQTSAPGIFAAGDCRVSPLKQVITACGDGAIAAVAAEHYVEELKGQAYK